MTRYIKNEEGGVTSVDDAHFDTYLTQTSNAGKTYLRPGFSEIKESEARKLNPQLFGTPDPQITLTDDELVRAATRKKLLAELHSEQVAVPDDTEA